MRHLRHQPGIFTKVRIWDNFHHSSSFDHHPLTSVATPLVKVTHVFAHSDPHVAAVLEGQVVEEDVLVAAAGHSDLGAAGVRARVLGLLPRLVAVQPLKWTETV